MAGFISDDSQGTRQKVTWADPGTYVDPNDKGNAANRQDGGWYFNKDTGYVEMWKQSGGGSNGSSSGGNSSGLGNITSTPGMGGGTSSVSLPEKPKIDLRAEYDSLYDSLGLADMKDAVKQSQQQLLAERASADQAISLASENPFYSEANLTGRIAKIEEAYSQKEQVLTAQSALKQQQYQDAQNNLWQQLDLEKQQYQYDYSAFQDNLNQMNYLLESGALSGADEASLEKMAATAGITTGMLRSMISAQEKKNSNPQLLQNVDDNGNVTLTLIDANTGKTINQQVLSGVAKSSGTGGGSGSGTSTIKVNDQDLYADTSDALSMIAADNVSWSKTHGTQNAVGSQYVQTDQWRDIFYDWQTRTGGGYADFKKQFSRYMDPGHYKEYDDAVIGN